MAAGRSQALANQGPRLWGIVIGAQGRRIAKCLVGCLAALLGLPAQAALPIRQGNTVETCGFPPVVSVRFRDHHCSATLVDPRLVLLAAHCGSGPALVHFGDNRHDNAGAFERVATCAANPNYQGPHDPGSDWGYCLLEQPLTEIPPVAVISECTRASLQANDVVWQVGYGAVAGTASDPVDSGFKRWGQTLVTGLDDAKRVLQTSADHDRYRDQPHWQASSGCPGDSGGPALVQLEDGTWRLVGILSTMLGEVCGGDNHYALLDDAIPLIAKATGIDLWACEPAANGSATSTCPAYLQSELGQVPGYGQWQDTCEKTSRAATRAACLPVWNDPSLAKLVIIPPTSSCAIGQGSSSKFGSFAGMLALLLVLRRRA